MNFQLFKTAASDKAIALPRVGFLVEILRDVMAPLYTINDEKHPEMAQLAKNLSRYFSKFESNARIFLSLRSRNPYEVFNKKLLSFKMSELRALAEGIEGSSIELNDRNIRALVDLILDEAVFIAWTEFCSMHPGVSLLAGSDGLAPSEIIRTAAKKTKKPENLESPDDKATRQRGRLTSRNEAKVRSFRAPLLSQGRAALAVLAYEAIYNATVAAELLGNTSGHDASSVEAFKGKSLSLMIHHIDLVDMTDNMSSAIKNACAPGLTRPILNGLPLTQDPPFGDILGGSFEDWMHSISSPDDEEGKKGMRKHALGFFAAMALGIDENTATSAAQRAITKRKAIHGEDAASSIIGGVERAAIGAHKRMSAAFASDPDLLKDKIAAILVAGFSAKINAMKINGVPTSTWTSIIPALQDPRTRQLADKALARILANLPDSFASMSEASTICSGVIEREDAKGEFKDVPKEKWTTRSETKIGSTFLSYLAQVILGLPIYLHAKLTNMVMTEALAPFPALDVSKEMNVGGSAFTTGQVIHLLLNAQQFASKGATFTPRVEIVLNLMSDAHVASKNLFIAASDLLDYETKQKEIQEEKTKLRTEVAPKPRLDSNLNASEKKTLESKQKAELDSKMKPLNASEKKILERKQNAETGIRIKTLQIIGEIKTVVNSAIKNLRKRQAAGDESVGGIPMSSIAVLIAAYDANNSDVYSAVFASMIMSFKSTSQSQEEIQSMCKKIIESDKNILPDEKDLKSFATLFYKSVPPKFLRELPSEVAGAYLGSVTAYKKDLASKEVGEGKDPIPQLGTGHDIIRTDTSSSSASWFLQRSSHIALVKSMMAEHTAVTLDENEEKLKKEIEDNVKIDPASGLGLVAKNDIDSKVEELAQTALLGQDWFEIIPQADELTKSKLKNPQAYLLVRNVNIFLRKNSKSSILTELRKQGFDDTYYDAFMVLVSREIGKTFGGMLAHNAVTRYSSKKEMSQSLGTEGIVTVSPEDSDDAQEAASSAGSGESSERERIINREDIETFVSRWYAYPTYQRNGAIGIQSLPGFLADIMHKSDLAIGGDAEARKYVNSLTKETDLSTGNIRKHPVLMAFKHSVRGAVGHELFYVPAFKNLATLLTYNKDAGGNITTHEAAARAIGLLTDPVHAAESLEAGNNRGDTYRLAFGRLMTKAGHMKVDNYLDWEAGMKEQLSIFKIQKTNQIQNLLTRGVISKGDKATLIAILERPFDGSVGFSTSYLSPDETVLLKAIGKAMTQLRTPAIDSVFKATVGSPLFKGRMMVYFGGDKAKVDAAFEKIQKDVSYKQALQLELSKQKMPASDVPEGVRVDSLLESYKILNSADESKAKKYQAALPKLEMHAEPDRYLEAIAKTQEFKQALVEWEAAGPEAFTGKVGDQQKTKLREFLSQSAEMPSKLARTGLIAAAFRINLADQFGSDFDASLVDDTGRQIDVSGTPGFKDSVTVLIDTVADHWKELIGESDKSVSLESVQPAVSVATVVDSAVSLQTLAQFSDGTRLGDAISTATSSSPQLKMFMQVVLGPKWNVSLYGGSRLSQTHQAIDDAIALFGEDSEAVLGVARTARGSATEEGLARNIQRHNRLAGDARATLVMISEQVDFADSDAADVEKEKKISSGATGSAAYNEMLQLEDSIKHARLPPDHTFSLYKRTYEMHAAYIADLVEKYKQAFEANYSDISEVSRLLSLKNMTLETASEQDIEAAVKQAMSKTASNPLLEATKQEATDNPGDFLIKHIENKDIAPSIKINIINFVRDRIKRPASLDRLGTNLADFVWNSVQLDLTNLGAVLASRSRGGPAYPALGKKIDASRYRPEEKEALKKNTTKWLDEAISSVVQEQARSIAARIHDVPEETEEAEEEVNPEFLAVRVAFAKTKGVELLKGLRFADDKAKETSELAAKAAAGKDMVSPEFRIEFKRAQSARDIAAKIDIAAQIVGSIEELTLEEDVVETDEEAGKKRNTRTEILNLCGDFLRGQDNENSHKVFADFVSALSSQINNETVLDNIKVSNMMLLKSDYVPRLIAIRRSAKSAKEIGTALVSLSKEIDKAIFENKYSMNFSPAAEKEESRFESEFDKELLRLNTKIDEVLSQIPATQNIEDVGMSPAEKGLENVRLALNSLSQDRRQVDEGRTDEVAIMSALVEIDKLISAKTAERATPGVMQLLMNKLSSFGVTSKSPGVKYYDIGSTLTVADDSAFESERQLLEEAVTSLKASGKPENEESVALLETFLHSYEEGMRKITRGANMRGAVSALREVRSDIAAGKRFDEKRISDVHSKLTDAGVITRATTAPHVVEVHESTLVRPIQDPFMEVDEGMLSPKEEDNKLPTAKPAFMEISEEDMEDMDPAVAPPKSTDVPFMEISEEDMGDFSPAIAPPESSAKGTPVAAGPFMEISEEDMEMALAPPESSETADMNEEPGEIADEDIVLLDAIKPTLTAPVAGEVSSPAVTPAQPTLPGVSAPAKATPTAVGFGTPSPSAESIIALDRIIEEIYSIDDILVGGGVTGPTHEALMGIESRLSAAKASKASIGDIDQLIDVLDRAMAVSDEVKSRDVSEFQGTTPASLAYLIDGVNNILMPKRAQKNMSSFVKMGDSWTILT
jgi:hypothetical protein